MKELDRVKQFMKNQQADFEERISNCQKVISENDLAIKQQEKFMETMRKEEQDDSFASRVQKETKDKNRAKEEAALENLQKEGKQRAFLLKNLEKQLAEIHSIEEDLAVFDNDEYVLIKKEEFLKKIDEAAKDAAKEAKKAIQKEIKEVQKKEAKKVVKTKETEEEKEFKEAFLEYAQVVTDFAFLDPARVLAELEVLKNRL